MRRLMELALIRDDREAKLPRWAQDKLEAMRIVMRHSREMAESAIQSTDPGGSLIAVDHYDYAVGIKGDVVTIRTSTSIRWADGIQIKVGEDRIRVSTQSGPLAIYPHCSNVVHLKEVERW